MFYSVLFFIIELYKASKFRNEGPRIATMKDYPTVPNKHIANESWKNIKSIYGKDSGKLIWKPPQK